jgi:hypothetical protein
MFSSLSSHGDVLQSNRSNTPTIGTNINMSDDSDEDSVGDIEEFDEDEYDEGDYEDDYDDIRAFEFYPEINDPELCAILDGNWDLEVLVGSLCVGQLVGHYLNSSAFYRIGITYCLILSTY